MQIPLKITFRGLEPSAAIEDRIRRKAAKLEKFRGTVTRCQVIVEAPHRHHRKGNTWSVRVELAVPGQRLGSLRDAGIDHAHEDVYVAIRDAFDAAYRRLEDHARLQRGDVKAHESWRTGRVVELHPVDEFGMLETADGARVYFHANSVLQKAFRRLAVGASVRFLVAEGEGEMGPQASSVRLVGLRRHTMPARAPA
jgi:cold shock CspA family protein/ribosome-associated translation inhibitor RaiA